MRNAIRRKYDDDTILWWPSWWESQSTISNQALLWN